MKTAIVFLLLSIQFGFGQIVRLSTDSLEMRSPTTAESFYIINDDSSPASISGIEAGPYHYLYYLSITLSDTIIEHMVFQPELDDSIHFVVPGTDSVEVTIGAIDLCPVCKFTDISDTFLDTLFFINNSLNEDTASIILYGAFSTGIEAESSPEISSFELLQNYPNPFNPETKIQIFVKNADEYDLSVFDLMGRRITTLVSGRLLPGNYEYTWGGIDKNGFHVSSGHYFYRLQSHGSSVVKAMQLIR